MPTALWPVPLLPAADPGPLRGHGDPQRWAHLRGRSTAGKGLRIKRTSTSRFMIQVNYVSSQNVSLSNLPPPVTMELTTLKSRTPPPQ